MLLCLSVNIIVILSPYFYMLEILRVCILGCGILVRNIFALKKCQDSYANTKPPRLPYSAVNIKSEIMLTFLFLIGKYWKHFIRKKKKQQTVFLPFVGSSIEIASIWSAGFKLAFQQNRSYALQRSFQLKSISVYL